VTAAGRITVTRRGGIAGVALTGSGTTDELPADQAAAARSVLERTDWGAAPARPQHPDAFTYEVTLDAPDGPHSRTFAEHELPDELRPLVNHLLG
jgi:hypothetical protein